VIADLGFDAGVGRAALNHTVGVGRRHAVAGGNRGGAGGRCGQVRLGRVREVGYSNAVSERLPANPFAARREPYAVSKGHAW
jgi:hypothetical protein